MVDRRLIYYIYICVPREITVGVRVIKNINQKCMLRICNSFLLNLLLFKEMYVYGTKKVSFPSPKECKICLCKSIK